LRPCLARLGAAALGISDTDGKDNTMVESTARGTMLFGGSPPGNPDWPVLEVWRFSSVGAVPQARSPWHTLVPYLFGGLDAILGLIAFALLLLACSYWKLSGYLESGEGKLGNADACKLPPLPPKQRIVLIMVGDDKPPSSPPPCPAGSPPSATMLERETSRGRARLKARRRTRRQSQGTTPGHTSTGRKIPTRTQARERPAGRTRTNSKPRKRPTRAWAGTKSRPAAALAARRQWRRKLGLLWDSEGGWGGGVKGSREGAFRISVLPQNMRGFGSDVFAPNEAFQIRT
ncbi:hypothetical protein Taro_000221, partial [Colocasia esculenta]|nr:hypothetical protein [Colocasia esculenta]